jgi:hypothetical protein
MRTNNEIIRTVQSKGPIFTVTAGRTGTTYVSRLFSLLPDTYSVHEAPPNFVVAMRRTQLKPEAGLAFCTNVKLPHIAQVKQTRYVEVSHLFCKGFLECFVKLGVVPNLLILQRAPRKVALSLLARNTVPARTPLGWKYLLAPCDRGVLPLDNWQLLTDYQLCFWYCLEIERRQILYEHAIKQLAGTTFRVEVDNLRNYETFCSMLDAFGFSGIEKLNGRLQKGHEMVSERKHNLNQKAIQVSSDQLAKWEEEVWDMIGYSDPGLRLSIENRYHDL